jgi:hypothetical protein
MKKLKRTPLFLIFILMLSSCVKHLDFNQIEDFSAKPIFESSLVYFTLDQVDFFDLVNSVEVVTPIDDTSGFTILKSKFVRDNLISAELNIEVNNQFDRKFTVNITFLDSNNVETYRFNPIIVEENNQNFNHKETISISGNTQFLSSTKISVSIELSPSSDGSVLDPNIEQKLEFKSSGIFYLKT